MASIQLKRLFEELGREKQIAGDAGKGIMVEPLEMLPMHPLTMQAQPGSASNYVKRSPWPTLMITRKADNETARRLW